MLSQLPSWSELDPDLLEHIAAKLSYPDVLRFKLVCSSWRDAAGRSGPLLLAPLTDGKPIQLGAFSVRDKTMYDLKWDLHEELHFVGSSHGWIIALDKSLDLLLYNFFSRESIYISEKSEIQGLADSRNTMNLKVNLIYKAVLTANPSGTSNETYRVVIIPHWCSKLASRGKSDAIWTVFGDADYYMDISCYDGILYAVADNGYTIEGWEFSKNSHYPSRKMSIKLNWDTDLSLSADYGPKLYLVPSKEEILYIERCIDELLNEEGEINWGYKTIKFRVFRLDRAEEKLVRVKSLKDQVIFLGGNNGTSLPSKHCQGFEPNSIYFSDESQGRLSECGIYGRDIGVFNLEDESIGEVYDCSCLEFDGTVPIWVIPN